MRDSLTVLAILLIGVLTAALVGPYIIDWDSHRALIERKLSEAAGTPVRVVGAIDLKLLPKPVFRFGGIAIGDGKAGRPRLSATALDAELSLTALMRGEVQVVDTTLIRPHLDLTQAPDGGFDLAIPPDATADRIAVDHVAIRDGTLALILADGRREILSGLDLDGEATSLRGPFKATGRVGSVPFRLATGAVDQGRLRLKLHLDGAGLRPSLDLDGIVTDQRPGGLGPGFDGSAAAGGQLPLDGSPATVPWHLTAHLRADRDAMAASDIELRAGADLRALIAGGEGTAAYAAGSALPAAALHLRGATLDIDDLAVAPADSSVAPPKGTDLLRQLLRLAGDGTAAVSLPLRLALSAGFDTASVAGQTLLGTSATIGLGPEPTAALAFSVEGPDGTHLALDGRVDPGPIRPVAGPFGAAPNATAAVFRGTAEARTGDLRRATAWLRPVMPGIAAWLAATVPGRSVAASGGIEASATGVTARDANLHVDGSVFGGTLSFTQAVGAERARLFADLSSEALDLDRLPDLSGAAAASSDLDLDLALSAATMTLPRPATAALPLGLVTAGKVALKLTKTGDDLKLERLSLDVDGARIDATASRGGRDGRAEAHVSAPQLGPLADTLASFIPSPAWAPLRAKAAALSPTEATLRVEAAAAGDGAFVPTRFALGGTAGETRFDVSLVPEGSAAGQSAESRPLAVTLRADAPDAGGLLRQVGASPVASGLGAAHIEGEGHGTVADGLTANLRAAIGVTTLNYSGQAKPVSGTGRLSLKSTDLHPILAAFGLPVAGAAVPADAAADVRWNGGTVEAGPLSGGVGPTLASGDLSLDLAAHRPGDPAPVVRGHLALDRLSLPTLLSLSLGLPSQPGPGAVWSTTPFAPAPAFLPRSEVNVSVGRLSLRDGLEGRDVAMTVTTGGGALVLSNAAGALDGGTFGGALTLRRDGPGASLSGRLTWTGLPLAVGVAAGRIGGVLDFVGTGDSPAALVAGLGGSGSLGLAGATLARTDPAAPARTLADFAARDAAAERGSDITDPTPADPEAIRSAFAANLDRGPLGFGDAQVSAMLAGGVLRTASLRLNGTATLAPGRGDAVSGWTADSVATLDLGTLNCSVRTDLRSGGDTEAVADWSGLLGGEMRRETDATGLVRALQAQAIARAQSRIDVMEQDIRERAAFNRRLKAIQADQQAARERAEAEKRAAIARAVAEAQAKADAAAQAAAAARAQAQAAAEAQRTAAEAQNAARQKAEDSRIQSQVGSAARADAAAREEADKQRFFDRALKGADPPLDPGARRTPPVPSGRNTPGDNPLDLQPPGTVPEKTSPEAPPAR